MSVAVTVPPQTHQHLELVVYMKDAARRFPLPSSGALTVGRSARNDICLEHGSVSRQHARLHVGREVYLEDLGSSNGTYLLRSEDPHAEAEVTAHRPEDVRIDPGDRVVLAPGAMLRIGGLLATVKSKSLAVEGLRPTVAPTAVPDLQDQSFGPSVLRDPDMKRIYELAERAAKTDISVLINGETGSGKEILAETLHHSSPRASRPFLRLNCAALTQSLLESELFGHERGAFTGAMGAKAGLLESTSGGTVFLDEIGELPLSTQAKLLRVLEERVVIRVGGTRSRPIDVRFVAATNRDLRREIVAGSFREDLYFRINGVTLEIPPLRQRQLEIEPLARFFLTRFCKRSSIPEPELTQEAIEAMLAYDWPGNVRELKNVMERAPFLSADGPIGAEHIPRNRPAGGGAFELYDADGMYDSKTRVLDSLPSGWAPSPAFSAPHGAGGPPSNPMAAGPPSSPFGAPPPSAQSVGPQSLPPPARAGDWGRSDERDSVAPSSHDIRSDSEKLRVMRALEECGGNQTRAAKRLGMSRRTLLNRLDAFGLPRPKKGR